MLIRGKDIRKRYYYYYWGIKFCGIIDNSYLCSQFIKFGNMKKTQKNDAGKKANEVQIDVESTNQHHTTSGTV